MQNLLHMEHIAKSYGRHAVLLDATLSVAEGECVALTGANGCGKSTLLRIAAGLTRPSHGIVRTGAPAQYVPETFPRVDIPLSRLLRTLDKIDCRDSSSLARSFALEAALNESIRNFSKGMLSKVAAIQALATDARILLLDEPVSGQDAPSRRAFCQRVKEKKRAGAAVLMACHESSLIDELADRVCRIESGMIASDASVETGECLCAQCALFLRGECDARRSCHHA